MKYFKTLLMGLLAGVLACQPDDSVNPGADSAAEAPNPKGEPTAVGQPTGPLTTQTIGPAGGTLFFAPSEPFTLKRLKSGKAK